MKISSFRCTKHDMYSIILSIQQMGQRLRFSSQNNTVEWKRVLSLKTRLFTWMRLVPLSPLWIAICLHLLQAEPCFHDDTRSRMITWLGLDPRPQSRISTPWKVSPFSLVKFGQHFANFWLTVRGPLEYIHEHTSHVNTLPQFIHSPPTIRHLKCDRVLQTKWLCKIDDQHPKFCTLVGKMLYMSV